MIEEIDFKILERLSKRGRGGIYASPRAIRNAIGPISYHGLIRRLDRLHICGLVLGSNGGGEWRIDGLGREVLRAREFGLPYPSSNVE